MATHNLKISTTIMMIVVIIIIRAWIFGVRKGITFWAKIEVVFFCSRTRISIFRNVGAQNRLQRYSLTKFLFSKILVHMINQKISCMRNSVFQNVGAHNQRQRNYMWKLLLQNIWVNIINYNEISSKNFCFKIYGWT